MSGSRDLSVGTLCVIAPRGRTVFGYQFYGSYPNEKGGYDRKKTTGDMIDAIERGEFITTSQRCCLASEMREKVDASFPFMTMTGSPFEEGEVVMVVHRPVHFGNSSVLVNLRMTRQTKLCEVIGSDGVTRWVKSGLLRVVK